MRGEHGSDEQGDGMFAKISGDITDAQSALRIRIIELAGQRKIRNALPELVRSGENGYLFEPNDKNKLEEYIVKIFSDKQLEMKMREKSLEIIKAHDFENTLRHFELLYKSLQ